MKDENVRIKVGSKLLWKQRSHSGRQLLDACVVTVTRVYKDCSFRVEDAEGKDKGRFKDSRSQISRDYDEDDQPEVRDWGNDGWGNTSGKIYPLPENVTDISLKAEINSQKATKAKEEADAQAERDERQAQIIEAQEGRLNLSARHMTIDPDLTMLNVLAKNGNELTVIYSFEIREGYDFQTQGTFDEYHVTAQAYGQTWSRGGSKGWITVRHDGRTIDEALEVIAVSLWD